MEEQSFIYKWKNSNILKNNTILLDKKRIKENLENDTPMLKETMQNVSMRALFNALKKTRTKPENKNKIDFIFNHGTQEQNEECPYAPPQIRVKYDNISRFFKVLKHTKNITRTVIMNKIKKKNETDEEYYERWLNSAKKSYPDWGTREEMLKSMDTTPDNNCKNIMGIQMRHLISFQLEERLTELLPKLNSEEKIILFLKYNYGQSQQDWEEKLKHITLAEKRLKIIWGKENKKVPGEDDVEQLKTHTRLLIFHIIRTLPQILDY